MNATKNVSIILVTTLISILFWSSEPLAKRLPDLQEKIYLTPEQALHQILPNSDKIEEQKFPVTPEKKALIENITDTVVETLDAPRESVRVLVTELPKANWGIAGVPASERK